MEKYVKVKPDEPEFKIAKDDILKIYLENPAEKGKANTELVAKMEKNSKSKTRNHIRPQIPDKKTQSRYAKRRI